jgi:hypothetical protein
LLEWLQWSPHPQLLDVVSSKHNSNHLSVNQWIRSAIRDSQQPSPIGFLF